MKLIDSVDHRFHQFGPNDKEPSTRITAEWLNSLQDEIIHVIRDLGKAEPDPNNPTQLVTAIDHFFKFGYPPILREIKLSEASSPTPLDLNFNLEKDGGYFYLFHGVCEQLISSEVNMTPFEVIAIKDSTTGQWSVTQKDFIAGKPAPLSIHAAQDGTLKALLMNWGSAAGKIHLMITKREKQM
jgi:hypothetical protein